MKKCFRELKVYLVIITILIFVGLAYVPVQGSDKPSLEVHFIDVGQGDSILLHSSDGTNILIDGGYSDNGKKIVIYLRKLGIKELDLVVSSHPHADHIGGLIDVLAGIPVNLVIDPGVVYSSGVFETYLVMIRERNIPFQTVLSGDSIPVDDPVLSLQVLAPYEKQLDYGDDVNDVSVVLKAVYGEISFLLAADAGFNTEDLLIWDQNLDLKSTILKIGHHGSKYSTSDLFLKAVKPEVAVIQVGQNDYGHPTDEVLGKLAYQKVQVYRNDLHGHIVITTDGSTYEVKVQKNVQISEDTRVNINKAPMGDIVDIPGMTYNIAREIVQYREYYQMFISFKELLKLGSMTPEILEQIKPYIKLAD